MIVQERLQLEKRIMFRQGERQGEIIGWKIRVVKKVEVWKLVVIGGIDCG